MEEIIKISDFEWEIPKKEEMRVKALIFASENLLKDMLKDKTIEQLKNVAKLKGIIKNSIAMPDAHQGYGFPIGGVAAFDLEEGVISPGGVGYDIDCSVRLVSTNIKTQDFQTKDIKKITKKIFNKIPSGVGREGGIRISDKELDHILEKGALWAVEKGYGSYEDLKNLEDSGTLKPANSQDVSKRAKSRGIGQLGTLGSGNHFLEIQKVEKIFDIENANKIGLFENQVCLMIHCGSRGLGHQVATDYIELMEKEYGHPYFDRELVNAPIKSKLGQKYFSAMNCAANFAFANKQVIYHLVSESLKEHFKNIKTKTIYEVCHNIAKLEKHKINGEEKEVLVMRKGATRSFPNQIVIIPGSMGTASYVLIGTKIALEKSFGSTAHGAGRVSSRANAWKNFSAEEVIEKLNKKGIEILAGSRKGLVEEAPEVYKDIEEVVKISDSLGIAKLVAKMVPLSVIKG